MALTEQEIDDIIDNHLNGSGNINSASKEIFAIHTSECERIAELAFNAAREDKELPFEIGFAYPTYQSYKDALSKV